MFRISALNDSSSSDDDSNKVQLVKTKEAKEAEAFAAYNKALSYQQKGNAVHAEKLLKNLFDHPLLKEAASLVEDDSQVQIKSHCGLQLLYSIHKNLATIFLQRDQLKEAMASYIEAVRIDSSEVTVWFKMGQVARKLNNYPLAKICFQQALQCNPNHWPSLDNAITVTFALGDYLMCLENISIALERDCGYPKGLALRRQIFTEQPSLEGMTKELFIYCDPKIHTLPVDKADCQEFIEEAQKIRATRRQLAMEDRERELKPVTFCNPLTPFTWKNVGEQLLELYDFATTSDPPKSLALEVDLRDYLFLDQSLFFGQFDQKDEPTSKTPVKNVENQPATQQGSASKIAQENTTQPGVQTNNAPTSLTPVSCLKDSAKESALLRRLHGNEEMPVLGIKENDKTMQLVNFEAAKEKSSVPKDLELMDVTDTFEMPLLQEEDMDIATLNLADIQKADFRPEMLMKEDDILGPSEVRSLENVLASVIDMEFGQDAVVNEKVQDPLGAYPADVSITLESDVLATDIKSLASLKHVASCNVEFTTSKSESSAASLLSTSGALISVGPATVQDSSQSASSSSPVKMSLSIPMPEKLPVYHSHSPFQTSPLHASQSSPESKSLASPHVISSPQHNLAPASSPTSPASSTTHLFSTPPKAHISSSTLTPHDISSVLSRSPQKAHTSPVVTHLDVHCFPSSPSPQNKVPVTRLIEPELSHVSQRKHTPLSSIISPTQQSSLHWSLASTPLDQAPKISLLSSEFTHSPITTSLLSPNNSTSCPKSASVYHSVMSSLEQRDSSLSQFQSLASGQYLHHALLSESSLKQSQKVDLPTSQLESPQKAVQPSTQMYGRKSSGEFIEDSVTPCSLPDSGTDGALQPPKAHQPSTSPGSRSTLNQLSLPPPPAAHCNTSPNRLPLYPQQPSPGTPQPTTEPPLYPPHRYGNLEPYMDISGSLSISQHHLNKLSALEAELLLKPSADHHTPASPDWSRLAGMNPRPSSTKSLTRSSSLPGYYTQSFDLPYISHNPISPFFSPRHDTPHLSKPHEHGHYPPSSSTLFPLPSYSKHSSMPQYLDINARPYSTLHPSISGLSPPIPKYPSHSALPASLLPPKSSSSLSPHHTSTKTTTPALSLQPDPSHKNPTPPKAPISSVNIRHLLQHSSKSHLSSLPHQQIYPGYHQATTHLPQPAATQFIEKSSHQAPVSRDHSYQKRGLLVQVMMDQVTPTASNSSSTPSISWSSQSGATSEASRATTKTTPVGSKRGPKRKLDDSLQDDWANEYKRRSTRSRNTRNKAEEKSVDYQKLMKNYFPKSLLSVECEDNNEKTDDMETDFNEEETTSRKPVSFEAVKKLTDTEEEDVKNYIKKCLKGHGILDLIYKYLLSLADKSDYIWYDGICDIFVKLYQRLRKHFTLPSVLDDDEDSYPLEGLKNYAVVILTWAELSLNRASADSELRNLSSPSKAAQSSTNIAKYFGDFFSDDMFFLSSLTGRSDALGSWLGHFNVRLYWLKARQHQLLGETLDAVDCFEIVQEMLMELEKENDKSLSVEVTIITPNIQEDKVISISQAKKQLEALQRCKSLEDTQKLYDEGSYDLVVKNLESTFNKKNMSPKTIAQKERPTQLLLLLNSLYNLKQKSACLHWAEISLNEAIIHYKRVPTVQLRQDWAATLVSIFACIDKLMDEDETILSSLSRFSLVRLANSLVAVIEISLDVALTVTEMPIGSLLPWKILYRVLKFEEQKNTAENPGDVEESNNRKDDDEEEEDEEFSPSLTMLTEAHEYLGRHSWCTKDDGLLLLFTMSELHKDLKENDREGHVFEQCVYCLYGHPNRKGKARHLSDHNAAPIDLTWDRAGVVFHYFSPLPPPEFDSYKIKSVTPEVENLLRRIYALVPADLHPSKHVSIISDYVEGNTSVFPSSPVKLTNPSKDPDNVCSLLYYLLADFYFKNKELTKAVRFYLLDLVLNRTRLDSWAGLALAKMNQIEQKLNSTELKMEMPIHKKSQSALKCFHRAVELEKGSRKLWLEYGSLAYQLHSHLSRQKKYKDMFALNIEVPQLFHTELLVIAKNSYLYANECEGDGTEEDWLTHYMLGKVAEKQKENPEVFLYHYKQAAICLHNEEAPYPKKIQFTTSPPKFALEALEVFYRIHVATLKIVLYGQNPNEHLDVLYKYVKEAQESPFARCEEKKLEEKCIEREENCPPPKAATSAPATAPKQTHVYHKNPTDHEYSRHKSGGNVQLGQGATSGVQQLAQEGSAPDVCRGQMDTNKTQGSDMEVTATDVGQGQTDSNKTQSSDMEVTATDVGQGQTDSNKTQGSDMEVTTTYVGQGQTDSNKIQGSDMEVTTTYVGQGQTDNNRPQGSGIEITAADVGHGRTEDYKPQGNDIDDVNTPTPTDVTTGSSGPPEDSQPVSSGSNSNSCDKNSQNPNTTPPDAASTEKPMETDDNSAVEPEGMDEVKQRSSQSPDEIGSCELLSLTSQNIFDVIIQEEIDKSRASSGSRNVDSSSNQSETAGTVMETNENTVLPVNENPETDKSSDAVKSNPSQADIVRMESKGFSPSHFSEDVEQEENNFPETVSMEVGEENKVSQLSKSIFDLNGDDQVDLIEDDEPPCTTEGVGLSVGTEDRAAQKTVDETRDLKVMEVRQEALSGEDKGLHTPSSLVAGGSSLEGKEKWETESKEKSGHEHMEISCAGDTEKNLEQEGTDGSTLVQDTASDNVSILEINQDQELSSMMLSDKSDSEGRDLQIKTESIHASESPLKTGSTPVNESPIKVESTHVSESPIKVESTPVGESPIKVESTPVSESPIKVENTLVSESPSKAGNSLVSESPSTVQNAVGDKTGSKTEIITVSESPKKSECTTVSESPLEPEIITIVDSPPKLGSSTVRESQSRTEFIIVTESPPKTGSNIDRESPSKTETITVTESPPKEDPKPVSETKDSTVSMPSDPIRLRAEIITKCLAGLGVCAERYSAHYKSLYRLADVYYFTKDLNKARDILLGRSDWQEHKHMPAAGLFAERKQSNFFQGLWKIPIEDIDRSGCFASHVHRSVVLLLKVLTELGDLDMLKTIRLQLKKTPDPGKKFLRDAERLVLADEAFLKCVEIVQNEMDAGDHWPESKREENLGRVYQLWQFGKGCDHLKKAAAALLRAFKIMMKGRTDINRLTEEQAILYCQNSLSKTPSSLTPGSSTSQAKPASEKGRTSQTAPVMSLEKSEKDMPGKQSDAYQPIRLNQALTQNSGKTVEPKEVSSNTQLRPDGGNTSVNKNQSLYFVKNVSQADKVPDIQHTSGNVATTAQNTATFIRQNSLLTSRHPAYTKLNEFVPSAQAPSGISKFSVTSLLQSNKVASEVKNRTNETVPSSVLTLPHMSRIDDDDDDVIIISESESNG